MMSKRSKTVFCAVSGGLIYVSDKLDRSNREILMPLVLNDGRIFRCDRPAMPTADCLTVNPTTSGKIFKLQNICGDSGVVAVFNLDENNTAVTGSISPCEIDGIEGEEFAIYEHFSKEFHILKAIVAKDRAKTKSSLRALPLDENVKQRLLEIKAKQEMYRKKLKRSYNK